MEGRGRSSIGRSKDASKEHGGSGHMRQSWARLLSNSPMNSSGKEGRHLVQEEVRAAVEETRIAKAVGMKQQGAWTRWENVGK